MSDNQVIFSMVRVGRMFPPTNKQVLRDISLGFYYGAKIGVLGLNGAGKSTLLRIIAGRDDGYSGEVAFSPGYSVGLLEQEPELDPQKTVRQVVEEAVQGVVDLLKRYDAVGEAFAAPDADYDALLAEQAGVDFWEARSLANLHPRVDILVVARFMPNGAVDASFGNGGLAEIFGMYSKG